MTELNAGDRVRVRMGVDKHDTDPKGTVRAIHGDQVEVHFDGEEEGQTHIYGRARMRRLKPKEQQEPDQSAA